MPNDSRKIRDLTDAEEARIQAGIVEDPENPEWTAEDFKNARPFAEVFPDLMESIQRARGRPKSESPKKRITLRLDQDVVERFRASGPGWQSRMNDALKKAAAGL